MTDRINRVGRPLARPGPQVQAADARASQATTFGYAGVALGLVGAVLGGLALLRRPGRSAA
jgi:hypothetical protein